MSKHEGPKIIFDLACLPKPMAYGYLSVAFWIVNFMMSPLKNIGQERDGKNMFLIGDSTTGKTHLL